MDWIKDNALESLGECVALLCCCFCLNKLFSVLHEKWVQRTLMNSILLILCFCLYCIVFNFDASFANSLHFFTLWCDKTEMSLTVFHCHTVLIENACRLLRKSMHRTVLSKIMINWVKWTSWAKSPSNYVIFLLESPLNFWI